MVRRGAGAAKWGQSSGAPLAGTLDFTVRAARNLPGPGAYNVDQSYRISGGKFTGFGKRYLDELTYNKKDIPGPAAYATMDNNPNVLGGRFSTSKVPNYIDIEAARARGIPSPGQYYRDVPYVSGGRWGRATPDGQLDIIMKKSKNTPAPWDYATVQAHELPGGKWSKFQAKSDIDWKILHASKTPAPGAYGLLPVPGGSPGGGRIGKGNPLSTLDVLARRSAAVPGPGQYNVDDSYENSTFCNKASSQWQRRAGTASAEPTHSGHDSFSQEHEKILDPDDLAKALHNRYQAARHVRSSISRSGVSDRSTRHVVGDYSDIPPDVMARRPRLLPG